MRAPAIPPQQHTWNLSDGYQLHGRIWPPATGSTTALLYLHGIQSHGGWYEWSASRLAQSGVGVILPDRRGSGLNSTDRGDTPSIQRWFDDLDELATWTRQTWHAQRLGVVAVSWGGKLAVAWQRARKPALDALLLIAPGLFSAVDVSAWTKLRIAIAALLSPRTRFDLPLSDPALFTENPAGRAFIEQDRWKLTAATPRFLLCSRNLDRVTNRAADPHAAVPLTLFLAERDRIIKNAATASWAAAARAVPENVVTFRDAAHTIEFEPDVTEFSKRLDEWVRRFADYGK